MSTSIQTAKRMLSYTNGGLYCIQVTLKNAVFYSHYDNLIPFENTQLFFPS